MMSYRHRALDKESLNPIRTGVFLGQSWTGCENVANGSHSQYCEWLSLAKFSHPFHSVNGLLIKDSSVIQLFSALKV